MNRALPAGKWGWRNHVGTYSAHRASRHSPYFVIAERGGDRGDVWATVDLRTGVIAKQFRDRTRIQEPFLSAEGTYLAGSAPAQGDERPGFEVWSFATGNRIQKFPSPDGRVPTVLGFGPPHLLLVHWPGNEAKLQSVDVRTRKGVELKTPPDANFDPTNVAFSPAGKYMLHYQPPGKVTVYESATLVKAGEVDLPARGADWGFLAIVFPVDGAEFAAIFSAVEEGRDRIVTVDFKTGKVLKELTATFDTWQGRWNAIQEKRVSCEYLPGNGGWRVGPRIIDRQTGMLVHTIQRGGIHDKIDYLDVLDEKTVLVSHQNWRRQAETTTVELPMAEVNKSLAEARLIAGQEKLACSVERVDLVRGEGTLSVNLPARSRPVDVSPDGKFVLARVGGDRIDVWDISQSPARHVAGFFPYGEKSGDGSSNQTVGTAQLIDGQRVLTTNQHNTEAVLWTLPDCSAFTTRKLDVPSKPCLSPDRKYTAFWNGQGVSIYDSLSGKPLGTLKGPKVRHGTLLYHPDGTLLAARVESGYSYLVVWDLSTGEVVSEFPIRNWSGNWQFAGRDHVIFGNDVYDLKRRSKIWAYHRDHWTTVEESATPDDRVWSVGQRNGKPHLYATKLPHPDAVDAAVKTIDPETVLAVKPGARVYLEVNTGNADTDAKVKPALVQKLIDAGFSPTTNAETPLKLAATVTSGEAKSVEYRIRGGGFGRAGDAGGGVQTASIPTFHLRIAFEHSGKTVWEIKSTHGGYAASLIWLAQGETVQDYINRHYGKPGDSFFTGVVPPRYAASDSEAGFGASRVAADGIKEYVPPKPAPPPPAR